MDSKKLKELIIMIKEGTLEKFLKITFLQRKSKEHPRTLVRGGCSQ